MASLRDKTLSGIFWSFLQKVGSRGMSLIITILLARLLTPEDFGLIGMLSIFIMLSQNLVRAGFTEALIQKKNADEEDYTSVFYINLATSIVLYGILYICAPFIAKFYKQPGLTNLTRVLSLVFVINAFGYVQETRLKKEIQFKKLMYVHLPSTFASGVIAVIMAFTGFGVWSIVGLQIANRLFYNVQLWLYAKWKPFKTFNVKKARSLFSFGSKLMLSGIMTSLYNNIFKIILGKFYPASSVGYFQNASQLQQAPSGTITAVLRDVSFPILASVQDDNKRLKTGFSKIMQQALYWICPFFVLSGIFALPLFRFVLGEQWVPAVPYYQWMCVVGVFGPLNTYNLNIVNVKGRSDVWLKLQFTRRILTIVVIFAFLSKGITALLIIYAASSLFAYLLFSHFGGRFIQYGLWEQIKDLSPVFMLNIAMGIAMYLLSRYILELKDIWQLITGFGTGGFLYWLLSKTLKLLPYKEAEDIFKAKILKKN